MSLNKFMHPRNKYKKPPNFKALAIKYPEFRKYAKQDISGKVCLDFKNLEAVRALTQTLLKEDFGLDVEIPLNRLIPTLPLRLNYLLWIEDLLKSSPKTGVYNGIDIGCGVSCVYPLLAATKFQWHMLATEVDTDSAFIASNNVRRNKLQDMVTVRIVEKDAMLDGVLDADTVYDFCMCNPPFFSSEEELEPQNKARNPSRAPPRNAHSGSKTELIVPGGETAFISKIIQDSIKLNKLVRIYTVMVGHKTSVSKVKQALQEAGVTKVTHTEFCQGRTTRWGIAWTLDSSVVLPQPKDPANKKNLPFTMESEMNVADTVLRLHQLMEQLQIAHTTLKEDPDLNIMEISAMVNTWSNLRKKKRREKFKQIASKTNDCEDLKSEAVQQNNRANSSYEESDIHQSIPIFEAAKGTNKEVKDFKLPNVDIVNLSTENNSEKLSNGVKRVICENEECPDLKQPKRVRFEDPFLCCTLVVKQVEQGAAVECCWLRGPGGRDAAHQVLQYLKNNLRAN